MREVLYKNLTGTDSHKRDLCIQERVTSNGITTTIERRCIYLVREKVYVEDTSNLDELKVLKRAGNARQKRPHYYILRKYDPHTGEDKLICKVFGTFYAIVGHYVFYIAFAQSFKINMEVMPIS